MESVFTPFSKKNSLKAYSSVEKKHKPLKLPFLIPAFYVFYTQVIRLFFSLRAFPVDKRKLNVLYYHKIHLKVLL